MVFGLTRAPQANVIRQRAKIGFGTILLLLVTLPICAEDAASRGKRASDSGTSTKLDRALPTENTLSAKNTSPALLPGAPEPVQPMRATIVPSSKVEVGHSEVLAWRTLAIAQHSAAVFDAWSTRKALMSGNGYERDPLMKPFANSATVYPATQAAPFLFDFLAYRMMRSRNRYLRGTWWLPQAASLIGSVWCGSRNLRVASLNAQMRSY